MLHPKIDFVNDKKYIISLEKRADRRIALTRHINNIGLKNTELFIGIDGEDLQYRGRLKKGQAGCRLSHLEIIKKAQQENLPHVIIIEDDCDFAPGFLSGLQKLIIPDDWDMLYFGAHNFRKLEMVNENIGRCVTTLSTVCYAVKREVYPLLIKNLQRDEILDVIYCNRIHLLINAYCVYPNLVTQKNGYSDIEKANVSYEKFYNKWD